MEFSNLWWSRILQVLLPCRTLVAQLCLTLCYPMDYSPPGFSVHGILQAKILERVAILFSRGFSWLRDQTWVSCTAGRFFTIWTTRETQDTILKAHKIGYIKVECACLLGLFNHVWLSAALWTVALQAPLSVGFSRQEYWSGFPCPPPGDLPDSRIKPVPLMSPALAGRFFTSSTTWEVLVVSFFFFAFKFVIQMVIILCGVLSSPINSINKVSINFL